MWYFTFSINEPTISAHFVVKSDNIDDAIKTFIEYTKHIRTVSDCYDFLTRDKYKTTIGAYKITSSAERPFLIGIDDIKENWPKYPVE